VAKSERNRRHRRRNEPEERDRAPDQTVEMEGGPDGEIDKGNPAAGDRLRIGMPSALSRHLASGNERKTGNDAEQNARAGPDPALVDRVLESKSRSDEHRERSKSREPRADCILFEHRGHNRTSLRRGVFSADPSAARRLFGSRDARSPSGRAGQGPTLHRSDPALEAGQSLFQGRSVRAHVNLRSVEGYRR
jgi:hypothetical protein